jgi:pimeloyl-ACP methyl ester carboxylesterase
LYTVTLPAKNTANHNSLRIVWIHGWGGSYEGMLPLANYFSDNYENILVDLDGFGRAAEPESPMSSSDYAEKLCAFLSTLPPKDTIVCGFSYGGRVAVHSSLLSDNVKGIILLSAAGIPTRHSLFWRIKASFIRSFRHIAEKHNSLSFLKKFAKGSRDYEQASAVMKKTLVMSLKEDISDKAAKIKVPALLIYGEKDTATPLYMAKEYHDLIKDSALYTLPNTDHLSVLTSFHTINIIEQFLIDKFHK